MNRIFFIFIFVLSAINAIAQDVIIKRDGNEIQAKVLKVSDTEINYVKWNNLEGPTYTLSKSEIFMIKYKNGEKDIFERDKEQDAKPVQTQPVPVYPSQNSYSQSMYRFDEKQNVLDKARRANSAAKTFDVIALPLGLVVGLGGMFLLDESNMIWAGLGVEVASLVVSSCLHAKANRLKRKASLYYGLNKKNIKIGNLPLQASVGLLDNGKVGVIVDF